MKLSAKYLGFSTFALLAFILAMAPVDKMSDVNPVTKSQLIKQINDMMLYIEADQVAHMVIDKDPSIQIIDVRREQDYAKYSIPGSYPIPLEKLLYDESLEMISRDKIIVLASNGNTLAGQAWILLRESGFKDVYVLHGGLNHWVQNFSNPQLDMNAATDDEIFTYEFRKAAGSVLMGTNVISTDDATTPAAKPKPVIRKKKTKKTNDGC
jgi:sulfur-carrier protein adenylyltransferase/sulfurtransferase